jgi:hypothetical protein
MLSPDTSLHIEPQEKSILKALRDCDLHVDRASLQLANGEVNCIVEPYEM